MPLPIFNVGAFFPGKKRVTTHERKGNFFVALRRNFYLGVRFRCFACCMYSFSMLFLYNTGKGLGASSSPSSFLIATSCPVTDGCPRRRRKEINLLFDPSQTALCFRQKSLVSLGHFKRPRNSNRAHREKSSFPFYSTLVVSLSIIFVRRGIKNLRTLQTKKAPSVNKTMKRERLFIGSLGAIYDLVR